MMLEWENTRVILKPGTRLKVFAAGEVVLVEGTGVYVEVQGGRNVVNVRGRDNKVYDKEDT